MNLNRIHTITGKTSITNVDLTEISSIHFRETKVSKGFLGLSVEKYYQINIILKTQSEIWLGFNDHKAAQQEYASLFTAWTEYLEWHPSSKH